MINVDFVQPFSVHINERLQVEYIVSFLKQHQLIVDGDVEINPGPTDDTQTPKIRKMKKNNFNFTPKRWDMHNFNHNARSAGNSVTTQGSDKDRPIGLVNVYNDCFFNSVVQALFAFPSFRNHV